MTTISYLFDEHTKRVCNCVFFAIFLIVIFILSPLSSYVVLSITVKIIVLVLLGYSIYSTISLGKKINNLNKSSLKPEFVSQLNINNMGNNIFTFFVVLLAIFIIKSFF